MISKDRSLDLLIIVCAALTGYFLQNYSNLKRSLDLESGALNNTKYANQSFLIFNRVPKAGSETLWGLLDILANHNGFQSYSDSAEVKNQRGSENCYLRAYEDRKSYVKMMRDEEVRFTINIYIHNTYISSR